MKKTRRKTSRYLINTFLIDFKKINEWKAATPAGIAIAASIAS
jgi:hypothetical protein